MFIQMLEYKLERMGGVLIKVAANYSSQTCPICSHVHKDNRKTQSMFLCTNPESAYKDNADHNAAVNSLKRAGFAKESESKYSARRSKLASFLTFLKGRTDPDGLCLQSQREWGTATSLGKLVKRTQ